MPGAPAAWVARPFHHATGERQDEPEQQQRKYEALHVFSSESVMMRSR
jgi:hypothetical protein